MSFVLMVRHAQTLWNIEHRLQGHTDVALSEAGIREARCRVIPDEFADYRWVASPLSRAVETARLMGVQNPKIEPRLIEMSWGDWEGHRLADLRCESPGAMRQLEGMGLDLRAPNGESPRDVQARLRTWFVENYDTGANFVALTHKGVIRACLALALDWDMLDKPPVKLDWRCAHLFKFLSDGAVRLERPNVSMGSGDA